MTRNRLTYARLILCESMRCGGSGWKEYDRVFCLQAAPDSTCVWNTLNVSLFTATFLSGRTEPGMSSPRPQWLIQAPIPAPFTSEPPVGSAARAAPTHELTVQAPPPITPHNIPQMMINTIQTLHKRTH